jgi:orotidine-5'-phosphate decarboxylase
MPRMNDILRESAERFGTISCLGIDPVRGEKTIPEEGTFEDDIVNYYTGMFNEMKEKNIYPASCKENQGFFLREDEPFDAIFEGARALAQVLHLNRESAIPAILDFKRGDIKKSSANYAVEGFDAWKADMVTVHPYMGEDSVGPFFEKGGAYMMCRTSNPSAKDLQDLAVVGRFVIDPETKERKLIDACDPTPLYMKVAELAVKWSKDEKYAGNVGVVLGATYPGELEEVANYFVNENAEVALLIPGVGAQGGSASECMERLAAAGYDHRLARISSSSGINFAWAKKGLTPDQAAKAAVDALEELNNEINLQKYLK